MQKILRAGFPNRNYPPVLAHLVYLFAAFAFSYVYFHKIIAPIDLYTDDYGGIIRVLNFDAISTIQFRLFIPLLFKLLSLPFSVPPKAIVFVLTFAFTYLTILAFYKLLSVYFTNKAFNAVASIFIIYSMFWNLVAVNNIYFFSDIASVFFMVVCLYLVLTNKFNLLLIAFFFACVNHYSIVFIIPVFLLHRYKMLFKAETMIYTAAMFLILAAYFGIAKMILPELPAERDDGFFKWDYLRTYNILTTGPKHLLLRDFIFNFGGIHIFAFLFLVLRGWKALKTEFVNVYLVTFIFIFLSLISFGIYFEELRCYVPMLPFVLIPCMLFFAPYMNTLLPLNDTVLKTKSGE